ncbi:TolC family protein [Flavobacterium wongokense]|uniref:TolC family protein n=1 Tax=Flavobacterium wongokense TaxID=2910674 RepID=UPI001F244756|nr:TolC family protein [Flavobacterium sp. WG47]MCF6133261.1 TolC family protein [Flavobacterium sp. WG47]
MTYRLQKIAILFILVLSYSANAQVKNWTLQECIEYAMKNNISVKQSELDAKATDIDKKLALGSFLPTLNAGASHSWNIGLNQNITTGLLENQTIQYTSASINSSIAIYNGLQNQNQWRKAKIAQLAAQYQLTKMQEDISLYVANAYLDILFNKENLKVQQAQLAFDEKQLNRTQELVNAGSIPRGDLLDMKATIATDNQRIITAENALLISRLSLAQLLKLDDFRNFDVADVNIEPTPSPVMAQTPEAIVEKAKEIRVEIKIAQANLDIAERNVKIAKGGLMPSLTGFYSFSTRASYSDQVTGFVLDPVNPTTIIGQVEGTGQNVVQPNYLPVFSKAAPVFDQFSANKGHNFGLELRVPIFNGFSAKGNVERSKVNYEKTKNAFDQAKLDLELNVYKAISDAKGALKTYEAALATVEAREGSFNYAKEKFEVGLMNAFDFNQSQTVYVTAQSDLIRAKYDYIFKSKVVELYFGIPIIQKQ